ncbi:hypothetical protein SCAR479_07654 [Seiridium cardinale]|uniref:Zn(2)-C6 fungal-type domain-containing protein n=1 Tax=Seiridium cardinale TaxID=138064 RepID=A0ABR2XP12_9PEZI
MVTPASDPQGQGNTVELAEVERARPRKRTWRACDKCSTQRARCDGSHPCRRCADYGYACTYNRPVKRRGRARLAARSEGAAAGLTNASQKEGLSHPPVASTSSALSLLVDQTEDGSVAESDRSESDDPDESPAHNESQELNGCGSQSGPAIPIPSPISVWQTSVSSLMAPCRYPVLRPVLPHLGGILSVSTACDLFEVYLIDPGSSLFRFAPPYILTRIFRRKSLLHFTNPRPISSALLATILWCCAQAAELPELLAPGARSRITKALYGLAVSLINEKPEDRWWRNASHSISEQTSGPPEASMAGGERSYPLAISTGDIKEQLGVVDDVLTFLLLCIAVSGGDFKADCQEWWYRAVRTTRSLGLHREDEPCPQLGLACKKPLCSCQLKSGQQNVSFLEAKEERRRVFWLLYCLDRHLALSFNRVLQIPDSYAEVNAPLPERIWETLDEISLSKHPLPVLGPPTTITGTGFFEYFLPLMVILGDIIELHHGRQHPRFHKFCNDEMSLLIERHINECHISLKVLSDNVGLLESGLQNRNRLVVAYGTHILYVLQVLLHSKWDAISMLDNDDGWIATQDFSRCASHAIAASEAVSMILEYDPELGFMPYLFGIYLLQGSFILLLFADRMPQLGLNQSVAQACETIIRAHEVCIVTLSTEFQRSFRRVVRSTLYSVRGINPTELEEYKLARRRVLSLYRWTKGARGLGI